MTFVSCYDDGDIRRQLQELEDSLTEFAGTAIASIDEQIAGITSSIDSLKTVDFELQGCISALVSQAEALEERIGALDGMGDDVDALEAELAVVKSAIEALKSNDVSLDAKIAALQTYVDDNLKSCKDWAESTFATLKHYDSLQTELASVRTTLEELESRLKNMDDEFVGKLTDAISVSESGMKTWVNKTLAESYYDMATVDAKLDALEKAFKDADALLQKDIEDQQAALELAKEELAKEYKEAISDAIETNDGLIDTMIADAIEEAQKALQSQLDEILAVVGDLDERLSLLESQLVARIQSLTYIPDSTDGKVMVADGDGCFVLKFLVRPEKLVAELQTLWETDAKVLSAFLCYSKHPATRSASDDLHPLKVLSFKALEGGILNVNLGVDPSHPLSSDFWDGNVPALVYIHITDGNNDFASDMIVLEGTRGGGDSEQDPDPKPNPEAQPDDYVDEYGINHGPGIEIDGVVWAPVNCGYHATDYQYGKLYQWGRKYGQGYEGYLWDIDRNNIGTVSDATTPTLIEGPVSLEDGNNEDNSNVFYTHSDSSDKDWLSPHDDKLWNSGTEEDPVKTEYDPCPFGWRVPTYNELNRLNQKYTYSKSSSINQNYSDWTTNEVGQIGFLFSGSTVNTEDVPQVLFPAAGYRCYSHGGVRRGSNGYYWSSRPHREGTSILLYFFYGGTNMLRQSREDGCPVRCVQQ